MTTRTRPSIDFKPRLFKVQAPRGFDPWGHEFDVPSMFVGWVYVAQYSGDVGDGGVKGFGLTPHAAMLDFDLKWNEP